MEIVNTAILKNPFNWAIVIFMLIIAGFIVDILASRVASLGVVTHGATSAA